MRLTIIWGDDMEKHQPKQLNFTPQPCCFDHCRTWDETAGGLPPSDHSPMCHNYKLHMFKKITLPGHGSFIDTIEGAKEFKKSVKGQDDEHLYKYEFVHMTQDQFEKLTDFTGF